MNPCVQQVTITDGAPVNPNISFLSFNKLSRPSRRSESFFRRCKVGYTSPVERVCVHRITPPYTEDLRQLVDTTGLSLDLQINVAMIR